MPALISKIKAIPDTTFDRAAENFQNTSLWELIYHFNTGDLEAAIATVPEIEAGLERYKGKVNEARRLTLLFNTAMVFFMAERPSDCLRFINRILDTGPIPHRRDIQRAARRFQLLLHLELGNFDLLEYLLRSAIRYFKQAGPKSQLETATLGLCQAGLQEGLLSETLLRRFSEDLRGGGNPERSRRRRASVLGGSAAQRAELAGSGIREMRINGSGAGPSPCSAGNRQGD